MQDGSFAESIALAGRVRSLWRLKLVVTLIVSILFWSIYLFLSRHAWFPLHTLPITMLDVWAGYHPAVWSWVYESIFLLTGLAPWLIVSREQLRRYVAGFAFLSLVSFLLFAIFPVASPRPASVSNSRFLIFITRVDGPLNAFPSLHAGCLIYNLALVHRMFGKSLIPWAAALLWLWALLILFGTLATKQHYALDLLAGAIIGAGADRLAWSRVYFGANTAKKIPRSNFWISQAGRR